MIAISTNEKRGCLKSHLKLERHSGPAFAEAATSRQALSRNPILHLKSGIVTPEA